MLSLWYVHYCSNYCNGRTTRYIWADTLDHHPEIDKLPKSVAASLLNSMSSDNSSKAHNANTAIDTTQKSLELKRCVLCKMVNTTAWFSTNDNPLLCRACSEFLLINGPAPSAPLVRVFGLFLCRLSEVLRLVPTRRNSIIMVHK